MKSMNYDKVPVTIRQKVLGQILALTRVCQGFCRGKSYFAFLQICINFLLYQFLEYSVVWAEACMTLLVLVVFKKILR